MSFALLFSMSALCGRSRRGSPNWARRSTRRNGRCVGFWSLRVSVFPFGLPSPGFYEFTPEGLKREGEIDPAESITRRTGRKLDFAIIGVLTVAVVLLLTDRFVLRNGVNEVIESRGRYAPNPLRGDRALRRLSSSAKLCTASARASQSGSCAN